MCGIGLSILHTAHNAFTGSVKRIDDSSHATEPQVDDAPGDEG